MKFFADSKPKKTEDEKYEEWFNKAQRQVDSKHFCVMWASLENQQDVTYIDRMIDEGFKILGIYSVTMERTRIVMQYPQGELRK